MFRNQYDSDVSTWSPQGRLHQVEYALEAVKQGSAVVGLKSKDFVVLVALNRSPSELAAYQKKLFKIDAHIGIGIAGLWSDARVLSNFMRSETLRSRMVYKRLLPVSRLVHAVGDKAQVNTQKMGKRPYGVGLLVAGVDETGSHLYECAPSGNVFDYRAVAIGARSQSAKTYLEKHFEGFDQGMFSRDLLVATLDQLVVHGLKALKDTLQSDKELNINNCSIGIVGKDVNFYVVESEGLQGYLDKLNESSNDAAMETDS